MSKMSVADKITYFATILRNKRSRERSLGLEMRLFRLNLELLQWINGIDHDSAAVRDKYTVSVLRMVKEIHDLKSLTPTISKILASVFSALGFSNYAETFIGSSSEEDKPLNFQFVKLVKSKTRVPYHEYMAITEHPVVWQLRRFGEFMDRSMNSRPDPRVKFEPDGWQRRVLDAIDDDRSLLVVGKSI